MTKETLKMLREDTGLSQEKFAFALGVSGSTISSWEQGRNPINPIYEKVILDAYSQLIKK